MPYAVCFVKPVSISLDTVRFCHVWFSIFDKGPLNTPCMGTPSALVAGWFWPWQSVLQFCERETLFNEANQCIVIAIVGGCNGASAISMRHATGDEDLCETS